MALFQLKNFADIVAAVREEVQGSTTQTNFINWIKRDINLIYQDVTAEKNWWWLEGSTTVQLPAYINSGTVSVTQGSAAITFSTAPSASQKGKLFSTDSFSEICVIESHTAGSTSAKLTDLYAGATSATAAYKLWINRLPLPVDCKETTEVWHDYQSNTLEGRGKQDFRKISQTAPRAEGKPQYYYTGDFVDPSPLSAISSLPATLTRSSSGIVKTIVFASALPVAVTTANTAGNPLRWNISAAGDPSYNGDIIVSSISTTTSTNDTITYTGKAETQESATSDTTIVVKNIDAEADYDRYRELYIYPSMNNARVTLHVDYVKEVFPLENDSDEPVIPTQDRNILVYGALHRVWSRLGNANQAAHNLALYQAKLAKMAGKLQDTLEMPRLQPSKIYLANKRSSQNRARLSDSGGFGPIGGSSGGQVVTGTASRVAIFGTDNNLIADPYVSNTELQYLQDVTDLTSVTLADNTSSAATAISWAHATYDTIIIEYSLKRGSSNKATGQIHISTDGSSAAIAQSESALGTLGVTWSVDVSGSDLRLRYTTTSTGTAVTMKYKAHKWLA